MKNISKKSATLVSCAMFALTSCGANSENIGSADSIPLITQGPYITANEVRSYVRQAGFPEYLVETLVNIAQCESSFGSGS